MKRYRSALIVRMRIRLVARARGTNRRAWRCGLPGWLRDLGNSGVPAAVTTDNGASERCWIRRGLGPYVLRPGGTGHSAR